MSQQDDERIARKLLDLGSRSDRVQIRNGMTYLDGYALGNGTVELRSQVVRDRRRRFIADEIVGYAAAILYEVVNGTNSEVWLQDDGGAPVLITTLPQRIELGWASSLSGQGTNTLGYIIRESIDSAVLDPITPTAFDQGKNIGVTTTAASIDGGPRLALGDFFVVILFPIGINVDSQMAYGPRVNSAENRISTLSHQQDSGISSITVRDFSNETSVFLQRRQGQRFAYVRHKPYHSATTPAPVREEGEIWLESQYWVNGTLTTNTTTPNPADPLPHLVTDPKQFVYDIQPGNPLLSGLGRTLFAGRNVVRLSPYEGYRVNTSDFGQFLTNGAPLDDFQFFKEVIRNDSNGNPLFVTEFANATFTGAPANARQILSVAIYPRV